MAEYIHDQAQKTEEPTARRLERAREEGNVAASKEVTSFVVFLFFTILLYFATPFLLKKVTRELRLYLASFHDFSLDVMSIKSLYISVTLTVAAALSAPFITSICAAFFSNWIQHQGFLFTPTSLKINFSKISPIVGFKRIFAFRSVVELLKNIIKVTAIGAIVFYVLKPELFATKELYNASLSTSLASLMHLVFKMFLIVCIITACLAVADYLYQRHAYLKDLCMTKQEVRDELKQSEGNPEVKGKLKKIRMQRMRQRMLAAVPEASVVITNPTHYAIALLYLPDEMHAPRVVAKGQDHLALKIKEVAKNNKVPVVENQVLARALYEAVEIDEFIPYEYYKAIADIISYVMRLNGNNTAFS